jgi:hypothetical protein
VSCWLQEYIRFGLTRIRVFYSVWWQIRDYDSRVRSFPEVRIALVGYEMLFPAALALAFALNKIKTVATQERFSCSFFPMAGFIVVCPTSRDCSGKCPATAAMDPDYPQAENDGS